MADQLAYVASPTSGIEVIDVATATQINLYQAGTQYEWIAITPDFSTLYATRTGAALVDIVDAVTGALITSATAGPAPLGVCIDPAGTFAYVGDAGSSNVYAIDTTTHLTTTITTIHTGANWPSVSPDGLTLYVASGNFISVIDVATQLQTGTIAMPIFISAQTPVGFLSNTVGYVGYSGTSKVVELDLAGLVPLTTISVTSSPDGMCLVLTPTTGAEVWSAGFGGILSDVSTASNTETHSYPVGTTPQGIAITTDNKTIVLSDSAANFVYLFDVATQVVTTVTTTGHGRGVCLGVVGTPPVSLVVGKLFIPRKGRAGLGGGYDEQDLLIDWLAIERWANNAWTPKAPNLFIPCKPSGRLPTIPELDTNWHQIELWTRSIGTLGGVAVPPLFLPRKTSLDDPDLDIDFLGIQNWANRIG